MKIKKIKTLRYHPPLQNGEIIMVYSNNILYEGLKGNIKFSYNAGKKANYYNTFGDYFSNI